MLNCNSQWRSSPDTHIRHQQAAVLRIRTRPKRPEDNLRELTWDSNPNCGIARERKREYFPTKSYNLRRSLAHSQNNGLSKSQRRASQLQTGPSPPPGAERQAGDSQSWRARDNLGPRDGILYQPESRLWAWDCPFLALAAAHLPPCPWWPVCSWLALLWYSLSPLICKQAQRCLRLQLFAVKFSLCLSLFSLSLAIPQFGLLSHVSSLRLSSGHSGILPKHAACASLFSPCLLVVDVNIWATSPVGAPLGI